MSAYRIMAAGNYGGDDLERQCWPLFLQPDWPSYETFWQRRVVRVTTRPTGMGFKSDAELAKIGCGPEDMCLAQLHYSVLGHLSVAYNYRKISQLSAIPKSAVHLGARVAPATSRWWRRCSQPGSARGSDRHSAEQRHAPFWPWVSGVLPWRPGGGARVAGPARAVEGALTRPVLAVLLGEPRLPLL